MAVGCVQHYSTHFIKKIGKLLEPLFKKTANKGKKVLKMLILAYFFTKNELYGQNDNSIPKPLLCLKFLKNVRKK